MTKSDKIFLIILTIFCAILVAFLVVSNNKSSKCISDLNEIKNQLQEWQLSD